MVSKNKTVLVTGKGVETMGAKIGIITCPWHNGDAQGAWTLIRKLQEKFPWLSFGWAGIGKYHQLIDNPMAGARNIRATVGGTEPIEITAFQMPSHEKAALDPDFDFTTNPTNLATPLGLETYMGFLESLAQWEGEGVIVQHVSLHGGDLRRRPPTNEEIAAAEYQAAMNLREMARAFPQFVIGIENIPDPRVGGERGQTIGELEEDRNPNPPPLRRVYDSLALGGRATRELVEAVGSPNVKVVFDVAHEACTPPVSGVEDLLALERTVAVLHFGGAHLVPQEPGVRVLFREGTMPWESTYSEEVLAEILRIAVEWGVPIIPEPREMDYRTRPRMKEMVAWIAQALKS